MAQAKALRGACRHLLGAHIGVAQKAGQADLSSPVPTQTTNPQAMTGGANQPIVQKDPPFSRRRSPNRPNETSTIALSPTGCDPFEHGIKNQMTTQLEMCEYGSPLWGGSAAPADGVGVCAC